jgi:ABC-type methionine transport system ATPase subunit
MLIGGLEKATSGKIFFQDQDLLLLMKMKFQKLEEKILELFFNLFI